MAVNASSVSWNQEKAHRWLVLLAFGAIYIIWGSTYLAIRYAVETIPPLMTAGVRHLSAGTALFAWAWMRGYRPTRREFYGSAILGALFFLVGHGSLHWAEQVVPSGLAALLVATEPLWITLVLLVLSHKQNLNFPNIAGLIVGFLGVLLLTTDHSLAGQSASLIGAIAIVVGCLAWSIGMIFSKHSTSLPSDSVARAGMSLLLGSWMLLATAGISGEFHGFRWSAVSAKSILGLLYLIVFGSIVAYTAYMWLLERCSPTLIATHTYVNPIVAVLLGWMLAGEAMNLRILFAAGLVVASVVCVSRGHSEPRESGEELDEEVA